MATGKYNFEDMSIGEIREFTDAPGTHSLLNSAKSWAKLRNLSWRFKTWTEGDDFETIFKIIRIQ